jgi:hypothetical protein
MAQKLGVKQPTVAEMKKKAATSNFLPSSVTLRRRGGKVKLDIELPDGTHFNIAL